jgi:transposase
MLTVMNRLYLSENEKQRLEDLYRHSKDVRENQRIGAILLKSEGWSISQIAQAFRKHKVSIARFIDDYKNNNKLKPESGGSESHLNQEQTKDLISHLEQNIYLTVSAIKEYILTKWNIEYSIRGLTNWLHTHGFSYKKPVGFPAKADKIKQQEFVEYYEKLKGNLSKKDIILFIDSVHPSQNTKLAYGWIKRGIDKAVPTTASRTRINLVGAINLQNLSQPIFDTYDTVNKESIIDFFKQVRKRYLDTDIINIILDGAGYHKAIDVQSVAKKLNIKLHFLPPYSPNLNPIERLWKVMNEKARNNRYFATKSCFIKAIDNFLYTTIPKTAQDLYTRINDNFQMLDNIKTAF